MRLAPLIAAGLLAGAPQSFPVAAPLPGGPLSVAATRADPSPYAPLLEETRRLLDRGLAERAEAAARKALSRIEEAGGAGSLDAARALDLLAEALLSEETEPEAIRTLAERALRIDESLLPPDDPEIATSLFLLGRALTSAGKASDAVPLLERSLSIRERVFGADHEAPAASRVSLGDALAEAGRPDEATEMIEEGIRIRERVLGPNHRMVGLGLLTLARIHLEAARVPEASRAAERALAIFGSTSQGMGDAAMAMNTLASARYMAGEFASARSDYERAVGVIEKRFGPGSARLIRPLCNLGGVLDELGESAAAVRALERARTLAERQWGPVNPDLAALLNSLAAALMKTGEFERARAIFGRAIAIAEGAGTAGRADAAGYRLNLGELARATGDYTAARREMETALRGLASAPDPDRAALALAHQNLGLTLTDAGDYLPAWRHYEEAREIQELALGADHPNLVNTLTGFAELLAAMGDDAGAIGLADRALAIALKVYGPRHSRIAEIQLVRGSMLQNSGDPAAKAAFENARSIFEESEGPESPAVGRAMLALAGLESASGRIEEALPLQRRGLELVEKGLGDRHPLLIGALLDEARLHLRARAPERARASIGRALALERGSFHGRHPVRGELLIALAGVELAEGRRSPALERALEGERVLRESLRRTARGLSERQALQYEASLTSGLDIALSLLADDTGGAAPRISVESVWDGVIQSRALVLDEMARRHRAPLPTSDPEIEAASEALARARGAYVSLLIGTSDPRAEDPRGNRLAEASRAMERAEHRLAELSSVHRREGDEAEIDGARVGRTLPEDGALLAYVRYRRRGGSDPDSAVPSYIALVRRQGSAPAMAIPLGPAAVIEARVGAWLGRVGHLPTGEEDAREALRAGESLRQAVWDPVSRFLAGARIVFIVPDGALNLISFQALPAAEEGRYLVEGDPLIHLLTAERDLVGKSRARPVSGGLLVLGGPDFDAGEPDGSASLDSVAPVPARFITAAPDRAPFRGAVPLCGGFSATRFAPLPGSRAEASLIARIWREGTAGRRDGERVVLELTGDRARESTFKSEAASFSALHLATHAFFLPDGCAVSGAESRARVSSGGDIGAGAGAGVSAGARAGSGDPLDAAGAAARSPLHLAGLALAGANQRSAAAPDATEDGILTAEEIASLDLSGAGWVVLSGCDTGGGAVLPGEGVLGLRRAFEIAGAGAVVLSLWKVPDDSTVEWMRRLYEARLRGASTPEAVRDAQRGMIESLRGAGRPPHPFLWGAFVAAGDWR